MYRKCKQEQTEPKLSRPKQREPKGVGFVNGGSASCRGNNTRII
jgi:hypothetical protein